MEKIETIKMALNGARSKQRSPETERRSRRAKKNKMLSRSRKLPEEYKELLTSRGLSLTRELVITKNVDFTPKSIRGQLLTAILEDTAYDKGYQAWIFDVSIRDLSLKGLQDGRKHDLSYLLECMADFVRLGILTRLYVKRGLPITYQVNVDADATL